MNTSEANTFIQAINTIVEGYTALARAFENSAWASFEDHAGMPGARPIAAAQLAQPPVEQAEPPWEEEPQPSNGPVTQVPQYYVSGNHEPIIAPATWDLVQAEIARRAKPGSSTTHPFASRMRVSDSLCAGGWFTSSPRIGRGKPRLVG